MTSSSPFRSLWILLAGIASFILAAVIIAFAYGTVFTPSEFVAYGAWALVTLSHVAAFFGAIFLIPLAIVAHRKRKKRGYDVDSRGGSS
jgi:uncharacterized membrane protein